MRRNFIYSGDCIQVLNNKIDENSIDLIFADPPYNLSGNGLKWLNNKTGGDWYMVDAWWDKMSAKDYLLFTREWITASHRVLKAHGSIYITTSYHNLAEIVMTLKSLKFKVNNIITWYKQNAMPNMTKRVFTHATEFIVWAVKGNGWTFNYEEIKKINPDKQQNGDPKQMRDFWMMPLVQGKERLRNNDKKALHPTQKPEEMLRRIILASSNENEVVLDPFLGTGTTTYIAKKYGRDWIGIELNKEYIRLAKQRMEGLDS